MGLLLAFQRVPSQPFTSACVYLAGVCAICGILGILVTVLFDRYMYGFLAIPILGNIHFNVILGKHRLDDQWEDNFEERTYSLPLLYERLW